MKRQIKSGIYLITNIINWKRYVGKDVNLPHRWRTHKYELNAGIHSNPHLQRSWDKYGESAFIYSILRRCKKEELVEWEQFYMDLYDCVNNDRRGYNMKNADGTEISEETRAKRAASMMGDKNPAKKPGVGAKISEAKKGKPRPDMIGKQYFLGWHRTDEEKTNIGDFQRGRVKSAEECANISKGKKGKPWTEAQWKSHNRRRTV